MKLTPQQIEHFNREGWLFLPELFSQEEVDFLAREAVNIYDANRPEVWREKSGAPRTAFAAHLYNEAFGVLGAHPRMIEPIRSEEHTSELQSLRHLVCRLLLEKKKQRTDDAHACRRQLCERLNGANYF